MRHHSDTDFGPPMRVLASRYRRAERVKECQLLMKESVALYPFLNLLGARVRKDWQRAETPGASNSACRLSFYNYVAKYSEIVNDG